MEMIVYLVFPKQYYLGRAVVHKLQNKLIYTESTVPDMILGLVKHAYDSSATVYTEKFNFCQTFEGQKQQPLCRSHYGLTFLFLSFFSQKVCLNGFSLLVACEPHKKCMTHKHLPWYHFREGSFFPLVEVDKWLYFCWLACMTAKVPSFKLM